jgi:hypothetical protein
MNKTSPKVTPSKGEIEEDIFFEPDRNSAEIIEVVHHELSEDEI